MAKIILAAYPGYAHDHGYTCRLMCGGGSPKRTVEVRKTAEVPDAVAAFGREVAAANPGASFMVSARVAPRERSPANFDKMEKATSFGGRAFLTHERDVDRDAAMDRALVAPQAVPQAA